MPVGERPRFAIIGAGLGGALMANYLGRAGYEVDVYERRPDPQSGKIPAGRSINLAVSERGIHALREVGLADKVLASAVPMRGRMIHSVTGQTAFQPYSKNRSEAINSISRGGLNVILIEAAREMPTVRFHFEHKCVDADLDAPSAELMREDDGQTVRSEGDILIGADGAFSAVRRAMQRLDRFDYSQDYLAHGYKELCIPPDATGGFAMEKHALHIWPRKAFMMIALPNADASYTCTLFWPFGGANSFDAVKTDDDLRRFFGEHFPDAVPLMPTLVEDYRENPVGSLVTVRCHPYHYRDRVMMLGDAAHAVVPFYGQGMNAAFEDCTVFNELIDRYAPDWGRVLSEYTALRKANCDALADLAIGNFLEMRDHAASAGFRAKKKLEQALHKFLPRTFVPLYSMVSFSRVPYAEAVRKANRQKGTLAGLALMLALVLIFVIVALVIGIETPAAAG